MVSISTTLKLISLQAELALDRFTTLCLRACQIGTPGRPALVDVHYPRPPPRAPPSGMAFMF